MSDRTIPSRRAFLGGLACLPLGWRTAAAQGFAGLGRDASGFAAVTPGRPLLFPADHGAHPDYRIEWWYVTANLTNAHGAACGVQWTLFRQAMRPGPQQDGWDNPQIWMGHAAVTRADTHRYAETFARGGIGQAGVDANPFCAWIDAWEMASPGSDEPMRLSPLQLTASGPDFDYTLRLEAGKPLMLEGDNGYSVKSDRGQASYYYSQPNFTATGTITIDDKHADVSGLAWLDHEWSSQPLAADQAGWDWFALHLATGEKLMLFQLRQTQGKGQGKPTVAGNWLGLDGRSTALSPERITMTPTATTDVAGRAIPTHWRIAIPGRGFEIESSPLNPRSWMGTSFPYWEGPIHFDGTHKGVGYLEMTGY